ncbi:unnamed protein product, partial [Tilletia caries]
ILIRTKIRLTKQFLLSRNSQADQSSSASSSSSDSSDDWTDTSSSSSDSSDSDSDVDIDFSFRHVPRDIEPLYLLLRRLRSSDSPSDWMFFRHLVRMTPDAFDSIVQLISVHSEFQNKNSKRLGASVEEQAAVVLYRFGR